MAEVSTKSTSRAPISFDVIDNSNHKIAENKFGPIRETDPSNIGGQACDFSLRVKISATKFVMSHTTLIVKWTIDRPSQT